MRHALILAALLAVGCPLAAAADTAPQFTINPVMVRGAASAPVTIVEFSDYQCPFCRRVQRTLTTILAEYPGKVRLVMKDFPLASHPGALPAAEAARCAGEHGLFWEYHDLLFLASSGFSRSDLLAYGARLGLPAETFAACLESGRYRDAVRADAAEGRAAGVTGTPTFFINGQRVVGAQPINAFRKAVDEALGAGADGKRP